jgi:hypothetical protein
MPTVIKETYEWDSYPKSLEDLMSNWLGGGSGRYKLVLFGLSAVC